MKQIIICDAVQFVEQSSLTLEVTRNFYGKYFVDGAYKRSTRNGRAGYIFGREFGVDTYEQQDKIESTSGIIAIMDTSVMDKFIDTKQEQTGNLVYENQLEKYIAGFLEIIFTPRNWEFNNYKLIDTIREISNNMILWVGASPNGHDIYIHRDKVKNFIDSIIIDDNVIYNDEE